jgi:hypothetical protein
VVNSGLNRSSDSMVDTVGGGRKAVRLYSAFMTVDLHDLFICSDFSIVETHQYIRMTSILHSLLAW